jgi:hypothetical protein
MHTFSHITPDRLFCSRCLSVFGTVDWMSWSFSTGLQITTMNIPYRGISVKCSKYFYWL